MTFEKNWQPPNFDRCYQAASQYLDGAYLYGEEPNEWLRSNLWRFPTSGRALAIADGEGRNGVALAQHGLTVTSIDKARSGTEKTLKLAEKRNTSVHAITEDLLKWTWPQDQFDVVACFYAHFASPHREMIHKKSCEALRSGGWLILESFTPKQLNYSSGGPKDARYLVSKEEIEQDFPALTIHCLMEGVVLLNASGGMIDRDKLNPLNNKSEASSQRPERSDQKRLGHLGTGYVIRALMKKE